MLVWKPAEGLWPVYMDPSQIDQICTNLCVNARDAMAESGCLIIVLSAGGARDAIALAADYSGEIDLLVTDVVMPEMNGRDLAQHLQSIRPGLKCLFMSGYTADVIARHGVLDPGVHFIQKPFSVQQLAGKVREAIEG